MAVHALEKVHDPSTFLLLGPRKADVEGYFGVSDFKSFESSVGGNICHWQRVRNLNCTPNPVLRN